MKVNVLLLTTCVIILGEVYAKTTYVKVEVSETKNTTTQLTMKKAKLKKNSFTVKDCNDKAEIDELNTLCEDYPMLRSCNKTLIAQVKETSKTTCENGGDITAELTDLSAEWEMLSEMTSNLSEHDKDARKRKKRSSFDNICTTNFKQKTLIYANDTTGEEVEVYQDIANRVFRVFYIKECDVQDSSLIPTGYSCQVEYVRAKSAVWELDSDNVRITNIVIPATCSLHLVLN